MKSLVIEDDPGNRMLLQRVLADYGEVEMVDRAEAAFELLFPYEQNRFDLVTIDLILPGENGFVVAQAIREIEKELAVMPRERLKLLVITALGDNEAVLKAYQSGADLFLRKPITLTALKCQLSEIGFLPES